MAPARAEFSLCNATSYVVRAAVAFKGAEDYISAGWFTIYPGFCRPVIDKPLTESTYYIHARTVSGHSGAMHHWAGDDRFCVAEADFDITGSGDCDKRGYDSAYFYAVDVGGAKTWTTSFTEPAGYDLEKAQIYGLQRLLADLGYLSVDSMDGYMGHSSVRAIGLFARAHNINTAEAPSLELFKALVQAAEDKAKGYGFEVCNRSAYGVWAAVGVPTGGAVTTKGWYEIRPDQCIKPIIERLSSSSVYLYAETVDSAQKKLYWRGTTKLCANDVMFSISGPAGECDDKSLVPIGFIRVDTQGRERWSYELKEPDAYLDPGS
jgi:uncharacterized membrane protein